MNGQNLDHVDQALRGVVARRRSKRVISICYSTLRLTALHTSYVGMSASHTTPSPSTGLALGGVPTEAS